MNIFKIFVISFIFVFYAGCASMSIMPINEGCELKGWGSGEGKIKGKCTVKKSIFTLPNFTAKVIP